MVALVGGKMEHYAQQAFFDPEALLDEVQAAALLGFSPRALQAWRHRGGGPKFVKVSSRAVRYFRKNLIEWAEERLRQSTSDQSEPQKKGA